MPLVTAIAAHPRREGRYRIEVDHETVAIVDANLVLEAQLRVGLEYDSELATRIEGGFARLLAFDQGLAALGRRGRSVRELERWLETRRERFDVLESTDGGEVPPALGTNVPVR